MLFYEKYLASFKIDFPMPIGSAFPLILLGHAVPPSLEFGAGLSHIFHQFLIELLIVGR